MSDLLRRAREWPLTADDTREAVMSDLADRIEALEAELATERVLSFRQQMQGYAAQIEADAALLRQALTALDVANRHGFLLADYEDTVTSTIAAIRARLEADRA